MSDIVLGSSDNNANKIPDFFHYIYSNQLNELICIKICSLEGKRPQKNFTQVVEDPYLNYVENHKNGDGVESHMYVTIQIFDGGKPISLSVQTRYKHYIKTPNRTLHNWNEWLELPLRYSDLPRDALAVLTIWDTHGPCGTVPVGGTSISLFGKYGAFRKKRKELLVWPDVIGDGSVNTSTPSKLPPHLANAEIVKLNKMIKNHNEGPMTRLDWLDRLTFTEVESKIAQQREKEPYLYLSIEFPRIFYEQNEHSVVYFEDGGEEPTRNFQNEENDVSKMLIQVPDHELSEKNLAEEKHHILVRSIQHCKIDMKPNAIIRDTLAKIISYPISKQLVSEEEDLIWNYRDYLKTNKQALTKFLRCVKWDRDAEKAYALELLKGWTPIDSADALQLLSKDFQEPEVRQYAVGILDGSNDDELVLYLLQLVQALKYENFEQIQNAKTPDELYNSLKRDGSIKKDFSSNSTIQEKKRPPEDLASFLIRRACKTTKLANYFFWYVFVETKGIHELNKEIEENKIVCMYIRVLKRFSHQLSKSSRESNQRRQLLMNQHKFVEQLADLMQQIQKDNTNRQRKIEKLRNSLALPSNDLSALGTIQEDVQDRFSFRQFSPIPLPLDPEVEVTGIIADESTLFKSNLMPAKLPFRTLDGGKYTVMFKHGDDLRQDQLVVQIIQLMNNLLREENLDLKLTPYRVIATSSKHGFVQIIQSRSIAEILDTDGSIQNFMRKNHPSADKEYGIDPEVLDTYIRSCAGYCVITYILGIGDRHLDNLMMTDKGALFHVDFGYILGRDPKPLPPPMKLTKEMVDAMGGPDSSYNKEFRKHCYTAFLHLRRHANLILNLFLLMTDADVPDIVMEPDKTVKKVQDKFLLELSDEAAVRQMQILIDASESDIMGSVVDQLHKLAQTFRK